MPTVSTFSFPVNEATLAIILAAFRNGDRDPNVNGGPGFLDDNAAVSLRGNFTAFTQGFPTAGTITSIFLTTRTGSLSLTELSIDISVLTQVVTSNNLTAFVNLLLGGNDTFVGDFADETFLGYDGNDIARGEGGNDTLDGGNGNDQLLGLAGDDRLLGGAGDDFLLGGTGNDLIDGGTGINTASFEHLERTAAPAGATVSLLLQGQSQATGFGNDTLINIQNLTGSFGSDQLRGDNNANLLWGLATGDDSLFGEGGDDVLTFGLTDGTMTGAKVADGGAGFDIVRFLSGGSVGVSVSLAITTSQRIYATGPSTATVRIENAEGLDGTTLADTLTGNNNANQLRGGSGDDTLIGAGGDDLLSGNAGSDAIDGGDGTDTAVMSGLRSAFTITTVNNVTTVVGEGTDTLRNVEFIRFSDQTIALPPRGGVNLVGTSDADTLVGTEFNDTLRGGTGNDILNGGAGVDAALYSGVRRQYGASSTSVSGGPEGGTDTLVSIEEARFVDGVLSFDVDGIAAQVMRLYDATLDRQPDQAGLDVQIRALATGATTLQGLANAFVASSEFQSRYGTLSNQQFVEQLYRFCLNREGDAAGIAAQVNALNTGTSRAALVVAFSESPEHRTLTQPILNAGLWVADEKALQIARLYDATLDRLPDAAGLAGQLAALNGGTSLLQLAANFVGSAEFQARYGALSNQQFVEQLYRFCLDREGDAPGIAAQVNALNSGTSRAQLVLAFSESAEHVALTAPLYSGGIRTSDRAFSATSLRDDGGKGAGRISLRC